MRKIEGERTISSRAGGKDLESRLSNLGLTSSCDKIAFLNRVDTLTISGGGVGGTGNRNTSSELLIKPVGWRTTGDAKQLIGRGNNLITGLLCWGRKHRASEQASGEGRLWQQTTPQGGRRTGESHSEEGISLQTPPPSSETA